MARRQSCDFLPSEEDLSALGFQETRADVDEGGFSGTVRANHRKTLTFVEREIDFVGYNHPAEPKRQLLCTDQLHHALSVAARSSNLPGLLPRRVRGSSPVIPVGATRITAMSVAPRSSFQTPAKNAAPKSWIT